MRLSTGKTLLVSALLLLLSPLTGCSSDEGSSVQQDANVGYQKDESQKQPNSDLDTTPPEGGVQEPVMVGGTFLVCADIPAISSATDVSTFGCRIEDQLGEKRIDFEPRPDDLSIYDGEHILASDIVAADVSDFWHWLVDYPGSISENLEVVAILPAGEGDQSIALKTKVKSSYPE